MLHFTRGSKVNTDVALSENPLSKSTRKSLLTSADAGLGWLLALLRLIHLSLQVAKQDTPTRTYASIRCWPSVETATQRSASALAFSRSRFSLQTKHEAEGQTSRGSAELGTGGRWPPARFYQPPMGGDSSWEIPEGGTPQEKFRTWPLRKIRWRFICFTSYQGNPFLPIVEIHFDIFRNET